MSVAVMLRSLIALVEVAEPSGVQVGKISGPIV